MKKHNPPLEALRRAVAKGIAEHGAIEEIPMTTDKRYNHLTISAAPGCKQFQPPASPAVLAWCAREPGWVKEEIAAALKPLTLRQFARTIKCDNPICPCHVLSQIQWYEMEPGWVLKNARSIKAALAAQSRRLAGQEILAAWNTPSADAADASAK